MRFVQVRVIGGESALSTEQKDEMIKDLTDAVASVEGDNLRGVIWVVIEKMEGGEWMIEGQPLNGGAITAGESTARRRSRDRGE
jgi:4-oxalocrotonate tautomerase